MTPLSWLRERGSLRTGVESWVTCVLGLSLGDAVKSVNKNLDYKMLHAFGLR